MLNNKRMLLLTASIFLIAFSLFSNQVNATWWDLAYPYRYPIISSTTEGSFSVNDTNKLNGNVIWAKILNSSYVYSTLSGPSGTLAIANQTNQNAWENETTMQGNTPTSVWSGYSAVYHLSDTAGIDSTLIYNETATAGTSVTKGVFGNALYFDGATSYLTVNDNANNLAIGSYNWSYSLWFNSTSMCSGESYTQIFWFESNNSKIASESCYGGTAGITWRYTNSTAGYEGATMKIEADPKTNQWYFLVITYNEATNYINVYLNGTLAMTKYTSDFVAGNGGATYPNTIGAYHSSHVGRFEGDIDEFRLYKNTLTQAQITDMWNNGINALTTLGAEEESSTATPTSITLYLNGSTSNQSLTYGSSLNATATINVTGLFVELYKNGTLIANGTTTSTNITTWGAGYYNFTASWPGNTTYSASSTTRWVNISKASTTISLAINGTEGNITMIYPNASNVTQWKTVTGGTQTLFRNGSSKTNPEIILLGAGVYNYTTTLDHENYTASPVTRYLTINPDPVVLYLAFNGTQSNVTLTYPVVVNITAWANDSVNGQQVLFRNGTNISNPTIYQPAYGLYNFTTSLNDNVNYSFAPVSYNLTIEKGNSGLTMTASPGWSIPENSLITITCSGLPGVILYRDDIIVSNPFSAIMPFGTYQFVCNNTDQYNYTPTTTTQTLNVQSGGFGCSDTNTYAFRKTLNVTGSTLNLNFSSLVNNSFVRSNLADVYLNTTNASITGKNGTSIVVNVANVSSISILFGNYLINNAYSNVSLSVNTTDISAYEEVNDYYVVNLVNEITGINLLPPNATTTLTLFCPGGTSSFSVNATKLTFATFQQISEMKVTVTYSATEIYYRNLLVNYPIEYKNVYLVDANDFQMVQFIIKLQDNTGEYGNSILKMKKYLEGTLQTMTELRFDAEKKAVVFLVNGDKYQIFVDNGVEERNIGYFLVDPTDLTKTIVIGPINATNMTYGNVSTYLDITAGVITFRWLDQGGQTQSVEFWVYNYTNSSDLLYYSNSTNHSFVEFNYAVPDPNASYIAKYLIHSNVFGANTTGAQQVLTGSYLYPPVFPLMFLIDLLIGSGPTAVAWFVMIFILPLSMIFTEKHKGLAGFVLVIFVALMDYWHVIALPTLFGIKYAIIGLGLFVSVMIELKSKRTVIVQ